MSSPFRENNTVVAFTFAFHISIPLANLWFIRLQGWFPILRTISCPDLYPLISTLRRPMELDTGRIFIPGCIRFPLTLAMYWIAHSLPLGSVVRDFLFAEDETKRHFLYLSGSFRKHIYEDETKRHFLYLSGSFRKHIYEDETKRHFL